MAFKRWAGGSICLCLLFLAACGVNSTTGSAGGSITSTTTASTTSASDWPTGTPAMSPTPGGGSALHAAIGTIQMVDAENGWGLTVFNNPQRAPQQLIHTTDGGHTWSDVTPPGYDATNGGASWQQLTSSLVFGKGGAVSFLTANTGFGTALNPSSGPVFDVTHDGGHTWSIATLPVPTLGSTILSADSESPIFTSATDGSMAVIYSTQQATYLAVYLTHDGGATWGISVVERGDCLASLPAADALFVACAQTYTSPISLYHLVGTSWQPVSISSMSAANLVGLLPDGELDMISATAGWAIANAGLSQTTDGGHTWTVLVPASVVAGS